MNITVNKYIIRTTINENETEIIIKSVSKTAMERIETAIRQLKDTDSGMSTSVITKTVGI